MVWLNRGIRSIEGKKTSVQCPLGRKLFNIKIALEMELLYTSIYQILIDISPSTVTGADCALVCPQYHGYLSIRLDG